MLIKINFKKYGQNLLEKYPSYLTKIAKLMMSKTHRMGVDGGAVGSRLPPTVEEAP